jgi:four helix bundle protein
MSSDSPLLLRSQAFAVAIAALIDSIPDTIKGRVVANQLMRSATSVAANYRSTRRARSIAEFVSKLGIVLEEIDESRYWLGYALEIGILCGEEVTRLQKEADEIAAMSFAARRTALERTRRKPDKPGSTGSAGSGGEPTSQCLSTERLQRRKAPRT